MLSKQGVVELYPKLLHLQVPSFQSCRKVPSAEIMLGMQSARQCKQASAAQKQGLAGSMSAATQAAQLVAQI